MTKSDAHDTSVAKTLKSWPSRNLDDLLEELSALGARFRAGESVRLPRISVWLRSGHALSGRVSDLHHDRQGARTLLLQVATTSSIDVAHVPWASIEAVTVHELESVDRPPGQSPPRLTREALSQRVANVSEALAQKIGAPVDLDMYPANDAELEPLEWLLSLTEDVLLDVLQIERVADSMRARVKKLRLCVDMQPHLVFADGVLTIATPIGWNERTSRESLRRELEALL